ncbi:MAG: isocitrate lyase/phosphoenolpyruvate mutase family protein [Psychromonas sp.]|nr:isocitrate lyase/phosphoenolpyruvate mutase family protein [Alteromonadales bacterium]MCP5076472.1 isocitrate lyase/phosphoenolpyruvate mutase family protein [Psychromonas sp.]
MTITLQKEKAKELLALHSADKALMLPNIWSPLGARILEDKGFSAVATASAAISASLGYKDGEKIKFTTLMDIVTRIANSVSIPTTVDIESGYSTTDDELIDVITQVLDAGVVGINIEDSFDGGLRNINEQANRISIIRKVAQNRGVPLVINARIDCFILNIFSSNSEQVESTIDRAKAYLSAGADCIFPVGVDDLDTLKYIRKNISAPINVLVLPEKLTISDMEELGINRFSYGPFIFRALLKQFTEIVDELKESGSTSKLDGNMLTYDETQQYLCAFSEK